MVHFKGMLLVGKHEETLLRINKHPSLFVCDVIYKQEMVYAWTNFSLQDEPWAEFSTLEVAASTPCTYYPV
jgi:hypothetical protein